MKEILYIILNSMQTISILIPLVLIYKSKTRDRLLWLFAGYFHVNLLFTLCGFYIYKDFLPAAVIQQYDFMVDLLNMFEGVWCMYIIHYCASGETLKKTAGIAAVLLFSAELIHTLLSGGSQQYTGYAVGVSIFSAFVFQLWWLYEHYTWHIYTRQQKASLYLNISMVINYGTFLCPYYFIYLSKQSQNNFQDWSILLSIPGIVATCIAATGIGMYISNGQQTQNVFLK